ncbi:fluoroquinolone export ABC transporter permease subunit [Crocinitomix catalasitica]|uniref:fluoroquinolone export ABC transporter permease subunit n=1 Tax=Crocinitomix catalasitica TaxID=184607 RepID=UPI0004823212|nr:hypothetical protein [Crocinitomix catalasitica]
MKQLLTLIKHDFLILNRNRIIALSLVVSALYIGAFMALRGFEQIEKLLILVIYNDPALLGVLFTGVLVLFEKNENTLQVISVSPIKISNYILSKSIVLTIVALLCSYLMAFSGHGFHFNYLHFGLGVALSTMTFSFIGFSIVATQDTFNKYMIVAVGVIVLFLLPFIGFFNLTSDVIFWIFPTQPGIKILSASFGQLGIMEIIISYVLAIIWCALFYKLAVKRITQKLKS